MHDKGGGERVYDQHFLIDVVSFRRASKQPNQVAERELRFVNFKLKLIVLSFVLVEERASRDARVHALHPDVSPASRLALRIHRLPNSH